MEKERARGKFFLRKSAFNVKQLRKDFLDVLRKRRMEKFHYFLTCLFSRNDLSLSLPNCERSFNFYDTNGKQRITNAANKKLDENPSESAKQ